MDPKVYGKLLTTHRKGYGVDVEALRGGFPLRQNAGDGSKMGSRGYRRLRRWNCVSLAPWMFSGYVGIYRREKYVGGRSWGPGDRGRTQEGWARPPISWPPSLLLDLQSKFSGSHSFQKSRSRRFHSVWTPFDIPFLQNTEIGKKKNSNSGWASG